MENIELKDLEPGKTEIRRVRGAVNGETIEFVYYYGNHSEPMVKSKSGKPYFNNLKYDLYKVYLYEFLLSDEGSQYRKPTDREIRQSTKYVKKMQKDLIFNFLENEAVRNQEQKIDAAKLYKQKLAQRKDEKEKRADLLDSLYGEQVIEKEIILTEQDKEFIEAQIEIIRQFEINQKIIEELRKDLGKANKIIERQKKIIYNEKLKTIKKTKKKIDKDKNSGESLLSSVSMMLIFSSIIGVAAILVIILR